MQIPRPTGGYWYRVQHGGCSEQVALPPAPIGVQTMIRFGPRLNAASPPEPEPAEPHAVVREENPSTTAAAAEVQSSRATAPAADNASAAAAQKRKNATRIPEAGPPAAEVPAPTFPDVVEMGREELYQHVWSTPCQVLARALGLSDVALAKTCAQMEIPRPPRGYWARLQAGEQMAKTALPAASGGSMWR